MLCNLECFGAYYFLQQSHNMIAAVVGLDTESVATEAGRALRDAFALRPQMGLEILADEAGLKALRALHLRLGAVFFLVALHLINL